MNPPRRHFHPCLLWLCLLAFAPALWAQNAPPLRPQSGEGVLAVSPAFLPRIYAGAITLDKDAYKPGDVVKGSFDLTNFSANDTGDLKCLVSLVRLDEGGHVAKMIYDRKRFGPIDLKGGEGVPVRFEYPLSFVPQDENLGIHIRVVSKDGADLAWAVKRLKVSGGVAVVLPRKGFLAVNGKQEFALQQGPTLQRGDSAAFNIWLENPSAEALKLVPEVQLTDKAGIPVKEIAPFEGKPVVLGAGQKALSTVELPVKGLKPQTYLAVLKYEDEKGMRRAPYFYARYIIGGDIVTVSSVLAERPAPIEKPCVMEVAVGYTGKPLDIAKSMTEALAQYTPVVADLEVKLLDENKAVVAEESLKGQKFDLEGFIKAPLKVGPAKSLTARVTVSQEGKVLGSYEGKVIYDAARAAAKESKKLAAFHEEKGAKALGGNKLPWIAAGALLLVLAVFLAAFLVAFKGRKKMNLPLLVLLAALVLSAAPSAWAALQNQTYFAASGSSFVETSYQDTATGGLAGGFPALQDLTGGPPAYVTPGQSFAVNATLDARGCDNSSCWLANVTSCNGTTYTASAGSTGDEFLKYQGLEDYSDIPTEIYMGTFTAPGGGAFNVSTDIKLWYWDTNGSNAWAEVADLQGYWTLNQPIPQTVSVTPTAPSVDATDWMSFTPSAADQNGNNVSTLNGGYNWSVSPSANVIDHGITNQVHYYQFMVPGNYTVSVSSPGNSNYAASSNTASAAVTVIPCPETVTLTPMSDAVSVGSSVTFNTSAVTNDGNNTDITSSNGGYSWSISPSTGWTNLAGGGNTGSVTLQFNTATSYSVTVWGNGNSTYAPSGKVTASVTVNQPLPQTITLSPSGVTVVRPASGSANSKTLTASGSQSGQAYTWSISPSGSGISVNPSGPNNNQAVANFTSSSPLGHYTVTATSPAGNGYLSGSASATVDFVSASSGTSIGARATAKSGYQEWFGPSNSVNTNIVLP